MVLLSYDYTDSMTIGQAAPGDPEVLAYSAETDSTKLTIEPRLSEARKRSSDPSNATWTAKNRG